MMSMIKTRPEQPAQVGQPPISPLYLPVSPRYLPASAYISQVGLPPRPPFSNAELCSGCLFSVEQEEHDGVRFVKFSQF